MSEPVHGMRVKVTTRVVGGTLVLDTFVPDLYTPEREAANENVFAVRFFDFSELKRPHEAVDFHTKKTRNAAFMLAQDPTTMDITVRASVWGPFPGSRLTLVNGETIETDDRREKIEFVTGDRMVSIQPAFEPLPSAEQERQAWSKLGAVSELTLDRLEAVIHHLTLAQVARLASAPTLPTALFEPIYLIGASEVMQSMAVNPATPSNLLGELSTFFPALVLLNTGLDLALLMDPAMKLHYQTRIAYEARGRQEMQRQG